MSASVHPAVAAQHAALLAGLPLADEADLAAVERGFLGTIDPPQVRDADGRVVWDAASYDFVTGPAPLSVNPSLWRQSGLVRRHGLFEVVPGIYQVRGLDLSNITFVEGDRGVLVIDPLISTECAAAALALYRAHRGDRPVTGLLYTHSHVDHFGGAKGVTTQEAVDAGEVVVLAPEGFVEHAVAENVYAGTAMGRRAGYMYGTPLERGPEGGVGAGLGQATSTGTVSMIVPTLTVTRTGERHTVDGIDLELQMAPGTEAPAEMHVYFPQHRALCAAENATHTMHNLLTLRGALVRDPRMWAHYLTEAITLFGERTDVVFASHHWPTWGREEAFAFIGLQRDLYAYLHDQTLRLLNRGLTGVQIAEEITLPPALERAWHAHGYYGSTSHNVKAVYQRYMGWYDGNPAHLWSLPAPESSRRYVAWMGGADAVVERARAAFADGDLRWVAEVLDHVVQAEPDHAGARALLADAHEQLGFGAENGTWRSAYLGAATELRQGPFGTPTETTSPDLLAALSVDQLLDSLAIRVDAPRCWDDRIEIDLDLGPEGATRLSLHHGVLVHGGPADRPADATLHLTRALLTQVVLGALGPDDFAAAGITTDGDATALPRLLAVLQEPDPDFPIVTSRR
ncbi:MBL fold metallo-hydrolase [Cellulomonas triticagri]|uniref:MBL fold metallo-hydrolase n=2 Tax=Cellulomonas triticagri TaxID=2483352 RepID=A0A3M2JJP2_9CELL|nr:MBL fold metallo-hydrolase [Cellulomonas triticagri]